MSIVWYRFDNIDDEDTTSLYTYTWSPCKVLLGPEVSSCQDVAAVSMSIIKVRCFEIITESLPLVSCIFIFMKNFEKERSK